jgi:hypothetical protein
MSSRTRFLAAALAAGSLAVAGFAHGSEAASESRAGFSHPSEITNPYSPISSFRRCRLSGSDEGTRLRVTRTLLARTKRFELRGVSVEAAIVKDRVRSRGRTIEITHDYFAQNDAGKVFYLGERVNEYLPGRPVSHEGQWLLGRDTKHPGVLMPAHPRVGDSFRSERVPGITHEVDHVVAARAHATAGGHRYSDVITVRENASPPPETEFKKYARNTGVISEANGGVVLRGCS